MNIDTQAKHNGMCICHIGEHKGHCLRDSLREAFCISVRPAVCKQRNQFIPKNSVMHRQAVKVTKSFPFIAASIINKYINLEMSQLWWLEHTFYLLCAVLSIGAYGEGRTCFP